MHADTIESRDTLEAWRNDPANKKLSKAGDDRTPPWTWKLYLYHDLEKVCMPFENLQRCMSIGATKVKVGKGQKTWKEDSIGEVLFVQEHLEFSNGGKTILMEDVNEIAEEKQFSKQAELVHKLGFSLYPKFVTVNKNKHLRVRPRFDSWKVKATIAVGEPLISAEVLKQWFYYAGKAGIGDGRPSSGRPYPFGTFDTSIVEV